jgi:hypothetical protein
MTESKRIAKVGNEIRVHSTALVVGGLAAEVLFISFFSAIDCATISWIAGSPVVISLICRRSSNDA